MTQDTGNFYNFSNIRYAAPPVGNLRFAPPQAPAENRAAVNKGNVSRYVQRPSRFVMNLFLALVNFALFSIYRVVLEVLTVSLCLLSQDLSTGQPCMGPGSSTVHNKHATWNTLQHFPDIYCARCKL
jgi:hypothetical protein